MIKALDKVNSKKMFLLVNQKYFQSYRKIKVLNSIWNAACGNFLFPGVMFTMSVLVVLMLYTELRKPIEIQYILWHYMTISQILLILFFLWGFFWEAVQLTRYCNNLLQCGIGSKYFKLHSTGYFLLRKSCPPIKVRLNNICTVEKHTVIIFFRNILENVINLLLTFWVYLLMYHSIRHLVHLVNVAIWEIETV